MTRRTATALGVLAALASQILPLAAQQEVRPDAPQVAAAGGAVVLTPDDIVRLPSGNRLFARIRFEEVSLPVLGPDRNARGHQLLRRLVASGQAAGNQGDLYENRDRGHSALPIAAHPQLTEVIYSKPLRDRGLDLGLGLAMLFDAPLIGNSSTAVTAGPFWRSLPRHALTSPGGPAALFANYLSGQIHVYPEHRDHDPGLGDLLPANVPYYLISQGSSGSDRPHLEALAMILAAFRPETKAKLRETGLIASTVQMVYRRARVGVRSREAYLSGAAHPSVFGAEAIDLARMVGLANGILPDAIPPLVRLEVLEETDARPGVDFFGDGLSETLFDTPSAIARIWRSRTGARKMVVSAAETVDPNGRPLTFDWVVLRGDRDRTRVTPLTADGRYALIELLWQDPQPAPGTPGISSHRVDIGVFANNGAHDSAPAFVSVLFPSHEERRYRTEPEPVSVLWQRQDDTYSDPLLFPRSDWKDIYSYDSDGVLLGWERHRGDTVSNFDADGARIGDDGTPVQVNYPIEAARSDSPRIVETVSGPSSE